MKQLRKLFVCLLSVVSVTSFGQSVQSGFVKEYNERMQKTPLSDVEIVISNASSTASGVRGDFMLQFRTLKPGDKVNVRRIEKLGYEIFNKEALEQWFISRDNTPFTIVMCKIDRFKRIRDNYSRVSSESYEKQLKKEEARIEAERKAGKIKEAEYEAAIKKLSDDYDQQLENLDNYVDRFARIDLSELSAIEAEIIELVQAGRIEEAIKKYDDQHLEEKYKEQVSVGRKAQIGIDALTDIKAQSQVSRDSLFASILRKNEMLKLAGGKENFEKIGKSLKETALADETNFEATWEYALFCVEENIHDEAEQFLNKSLLLTKDSLKISDIYNRLGGIYEQTNRSSEAERLFKLALTYINKAVYHKETAATYNNLGVLFSHLRQYEKAEEFLLKSMSIREALYDSSIIETIYELVCSYNNLGMLNGRMLKLETAEMYYKRALPLDSILELRGNMVQRTHIGTTYNNLATTYHRLSNFNDAEKYYMLSIEKSKEYVKNNPGKYLQDIIRTETNLAALLMDQEKILEARAMAEDAIYRLKPLSKKYPNTYRGMVINCYNTLANICNLQKDYNSAIIFYQKAIDNVEMLPHSKNTTYVKGVLWGNYGVVQMYVNNYAQAESAYKQSLIYFEQISNKSNEAYLPNIATEQFNLGALYRLFLNNRTQAEYYLILSIENYHILNKSHPKVYDKQLAQALSGLSQLYSKEGKFEYAKSCLTEAQLIMPNIADVLDAQGVFEYLLGNVDKAKEIWERMKQLDPSEAHINSGLYDLLINHQKDK